MRSSIESFKCTFPKELHPINWHGYNTQFPIKLSFLLPLISAPSQQTSHLNSPGSVSCPDCGKVMSHRASLQRHINDVHLKLKPWKCQLCSTTFTRKRNLVNHVKMLHVAKRSVVCRFCGASFSNDSHRTLHEQKAHSKRGSPNIWWDGPGLC